MLDEISVPDAMVASVGDELADDVELVVAREEQRALFEFIFGGTAEAHEVFDDVGNAGAAQDFFPKVAGFVTIEVGRVTGAVVVPLVKR